MLFEHEGRDEIREYYYIRDLVFDYILQSGIKGLSHILEGNMLDIMDSLIEKDEEIKLDRIFLI